VLDESVSMIGRIGSFHPVWAGIARQIS